MCSKAGFSCSGRTRTDFRLLEFSKRGIPALITREVKLRREQGPTSKDRRPFSVGAQRRATSDEGGGASAARQLVIRGCPARVVRDDRAALQMQTSPQRSTRALHETLQRGTSRPSTTPSPRACSLNWEAAERASPHRAEPSRDEPPRRTAAQSAQCGTSTNGAHAYEKPPLENATSATPRHFWPHSHAASSPLSPGKMK